MHCHILHHLEMVDQEVKVYGMKLLWDVSATFPNCKHSSNRIGNRVVAQGMPVINDVPIVSCWFLTICSFGF